MWWHPGRGRVSCQLGPEAVVVGLTHLCSAALVLGESSVLGWGYTGVHGCSAHPGQRQVGHAPPAQPCPCAQPHALRRLRLGTGCGMHL